MADAVLVQIADALVTHLNAASLSQTFTATRKFLPHFEREKLTGLEVTVFPRSDAATPATRSKSEHTYLVDVVIRQPVDPDSESDLKAATQLTEEMADRIANNDMAGAGWTLIENDPMYSVEILGESREFLAVQTVTYLKTR